MYPAVGAFYDNMLKPLITAFLIGWDMHLFLF